jgi:hypothetical protein
VFGNRGVSIWLLYSSLEDLMPYNKWIKKLHGAVSTDNLYIQMVVVLLDQTHRSM